MPASRLSHYVAAELLLIQCGLWDETCWSLSDVHSMTRADDIVQSTLFISRLSTSSSPPSSVSNGSAIWRHTETQQKPLAAIHYRPSASAFVNPTLICLFQSLILQTSSFHPHHPRPVPCHRGLLIPPTTAYKIPHCTWSIKEKSDIIRYTPWVPWQRGPWSTCNCNSCKSKYSSG